MLWRRGGVLPGRRAGGRLRGSGLRPAEAGVSVCLEGAQQVEGRLKMRL